MSSAPRDGVGPLSSPSSAANETLVRPTEPAGPSGSRSAENARSMVARAAGVVASVLLVAYPVAFFAGVLSGRLREASWIIVALLLPAAALRLRTFRWSALKGGDLSTMAFVPVIAIAMVAVSALLNDAGAALFVPVAVNALLLLAFAPTLWRGQPIIERFARMQHSDLNADERRWCRQWTIIWCVFFALNVALVTALAFAAPLSWWAIYTGGLSYALMGTLVSVEWMLRKARFGRIGASLPERVLVRVVPPVRRRLEADRAAAGASP